MIKYQFSFLNLYNMHKKWLPFGVVCSFFAEGPICPGPNFPYVVGYQKLKRMKKEIIFLYFTSVN